MTKKVDFDEYVDEYNNLLNKNLSFFSKDDSYFCRYKIELLKRYSRKEPLKILEFGCGIGRNIPFVKEFFPYAQVYGYDVSRKSVEYAQSKYDYFKPVWEFADFKGHFDLIFCSAVYHHIQPEERKTATKDIFDMLSLNGEFFVFEHNPLNPVTRKLVDRCPYDEDAVLIGPKEMKELSKEAGFSNFLLRYYLYFPPVLKIAFLEKFLVFLPFGGQYMLKSVKK